MAMAHPGDASTNGPGDEFNTGIGPDGGPLYGPAGAPARRLTHEEIKAIISREIEDSLGGLGSKISEQQRFALRMYQGRKIGNEVKGRSEVVSMDVLETIEWTMPSLMRIFFGGSQVVRFMPRSQKDKQKAEESEQNAKDATAYINYLFLEKLQGFEIFYDWFKSALLEKNGIIKVYWDERRHPEVRSYTGLTEDEAAVLLDEENVEPLSADERIEIINGQEVKMIDMDVRKWVVERGIKIDAVPNEEFLIARRTTRLNDEAAFTGHRKRLTVSDLVAMGFPFSEVALIPSDDMPEYSQGRTERLSEDETAPAALNERMDPASREIWTTDCWIRIDEDGDGYSELRNILVVGEAAMTILDDQEAGMNPFCSICPIPMPHKFYGNSLADLVIDIQVIRSTVLRQVLDHLYLSVNPRTQVVEGQVNYDDLMTVVPGGMVRVRNLESIAPLELPPLPSAAIDVWKELEQIRGNRTGVIAHGTEIDASAVNSTASGLAQLMAEKAQKIELMARIFSKTGMVQCFKKMLRLTVENATKEEQVFINNRWLTIDPERWDADMECEIEIGLGAGQSVERVANLEKIAAVQKQMVEGGLLNITVTLDQIYNTAAEITEVVGFKNAHKFFNEPMDEQGQPLEMPPPPPDPDMEKLKLEAMKAEQDGRLKTQQQELDATKQKQLQQYRIMEIESQERLEGKRIESAETIAIGAQQAQVESAQIAASSRAKQAKKAKEGKTSDD